MKYTFLFGNICRYDVHYWRRNKSVQEKKNYACVYAHQGGVEVHVLHVFLLVAVQSAVNHVADRLVADVLVSAAVEHLLISLEYMYVHQNLPQKKLSDIKSMKLGSNLSIYTYVCEKKVSPVIINLVDRFRVCEGRCNQRRNVFLVGEGDKLLPMQR